jgi:HNH endonuclease
MPINPQLAEAVRVRAGHACEYCRVPQAGYPTVTFPIDHVVARQHRGPTDPRNLALSCLHCNSHKGPNVAGYDRKTRKLTPLYNPRRHRWSRHFRWIGPRIVERTAIGRVTVLVLDLNADRPVWARSLLIDQAILVTDTT